MPQSYDVESFFPDNYYRIRNEINDNYDLCSVGLAMYSDMSRFANNKTHALFFSVAWFAKKRKVGRGKAGKIFKELQEKNLLRITGKTQQGARTIQLLKPDKVFYLGQVSQSDQGDVSDKAGGCAKGDIINTNKTILIKQYTRNEILKKYRNLAPKTSEQIKHYWETGRVPDDLTRMANKIIKEAG